MKNVKYVIIAIACICVLCAGFFFFTQDQKENEKDLTEIEKVIVKDLKNNYPKTPREVVKFYNRIVKCYYGSEEPTEKQLNDLVDQMIGIMDDDLLLVNPRDTYYNSVVSDIEQYKQAKKQLVSTDVCGSNDVKYVTDDKDGEKDELAYVKASYFMNTDGKFAYTYQQFVLRQDEDGRWKIITFYQVEGEESDDK
ncbi:MAG: hypothetical protein IJ455_00810 [Agathobacter sp.]|nr:hypothetical protein [Agathobacter sp.]